MQGRRMLATDFLDRLYWCSCRPLWQRGVVAAMERESVNLLYLRCVIELAASHSLVSNLLDGPWWASSYIYKERIFSWPGLGD
jgi:hypothetical protein